MKRQDRVVVSETAKQTLSNGVTRRVTQSMTYSDDGSSGLGLRLLTFSIYIIFLILFCVAFYRYTVGMPLPTFTGLLDLVQTVPNLVLSPDFLGTITADWGIFNFLRDFFNVLISIFGVGLYGCTCIVQIITLLSWFIAWAFAIV